MHAEETPSCLPVGPRCQWIARNAQFLAEVDELLEVELAEEVRRRHNSRVDDGGHVEVAVVRHDGHLRIDRREHHVSRLDVGASYSDVFRRSGHVGKTERVLLDESEHHLLPCALWEKGHHFVR